MSSENIENLDETKKSSSLGSKDHFSDNAEKTENFHRNDENEDYNYEWEPEAEDEGAETPGQVEDLLEVYHERGDTYDTSSLPRYSHGLNEEEVEDQKVQELARFSQSLGITGIARIKLSPLTQKILGCVIDENVTTEYPWIFVDKEAIEDNIDLHAESTDFLPIKDEISAYEEKQMLLGYAPTLLDSNDFYICLTKESRDVVNQHIEKVRKEQEQHVLESVQKVPEEWEGLGSAEEINYFVVKKSRPLYEIQIEATIGELKCTNAIADKIQSERNDYVEIVPSERETFENVKRSLMDKASENLPIYNEHDVQTEAVMPLNAICQCILDKEPMVEPGPVNLKNLEKFLKDRSPEIIEQIQTNSTWDIYKNDYIKLIPDTVKPLPMPSEGYTERQNFYNGQLTKGLLITDVSYHPEWTGIIVAAYCGLSKNQVVSGRPPMRMSTGNMMCQVLIWSFDDCLNPKLLLESRREVTSVSFCPSNGNIIIGGCSNGQVIIWDITGKIEDVERVVVRTPEQIKYHSILKSHMTWMKETLSSSIIKPTATSSLEFSQKSNITNIKWLSPFRTLDSSGKVQDLPEDTPPEELNLQFLTSSQDGTIACWNLKWRPPEDPKEQKEKRRKMKNVPEALTQSISPFKILDNIFKPTYMLVVQYPNHNRNAKITCISVQKVQIHKEPLEINKELSGEITTRKLYKAVPKKMNTESLLSDDRIFVGTAMGECGIISWEGYDFSTGVSLNREVCKWVWVTSIHDGPVYYSTRSPFLKDVILSVGGTIFAIWREDFSEPVFWRQTSTVWRYTACCWDKNKPTQFIVGRDDGNVETWDMIIKSHEPNIVESLSGRIITGIYGHTLPLKLNCVAFCDFNGCLRLFIAPKVLVKSTENDAKWMRQFVDREVNIRQEYKKYMEKKKQEYNKNQKNIKKLITETESKSKVLKEEAKIEAARNAKKKERKNLMEKLRARWVTREMDRMQDVILERKGLTKEELDKRREPILKMKKEAKVKQVKRQHILETADDSFIEAVDTNFPYYNKKWCDKDLNKDAYTSTAEITPIGDYLRSDEKYIEEYKELETQALAMINEAALREPEFDWRTFIREGEMRRKCLDVNLKEQDRLLDSVSDTFKSLRNDHFCSSDESLEGLSKENPIAESSRIE